MPPPRNEPLSETDVRNPASEVWVVRADDADRRAWLADNPICPALSRHRIRHCGVGHMLAPFEIVRTRLGGSYFLACFGGEGRVLVDGRWAKSRPGEAMLLPPWTLQAFHTPTGGRWDHAWVRYFEDGSPPLAAAQTPVFAKFDAEPFRHAILGLHHECRGANGPAAVAHFADLVHLYVLRFAQPAAMDPRVWQLWERVAADLGAAWSLADMAKAVHLSEKQLQRLCLRDLGRTPRQHLIWLRMSKAGDLLVGGEAKVRSVAGRVGYANPFVFSSTFKRVMGCSPSEYPGRKAGRA
jgi:AraC-like DNA-binding protein